MEYGIIQESETQTETAREVGVYRKFDVGTENFFEEYIEKKEGYYLFKVLLSVKGDAPM